MLESCPGLDLYQLVWYWLLSALQPHTEGAKMVPVPTLTPCTCEGGSFQLSAGPPDPSDDEASRRQLSLEWSSRIWLTLLRLSFVLPPLIV